MKCQYESVCGGCDLIQSSFREQIEKKRELLIVTFKNSGVVIAEGNAIKVITPLEFESRDRIDFIAKEKNGSTVFGLYSRQPNKTLNSEKPEHSDSNNKYVGDNLTHCREIIDIKDCPQMSKQLSLWYHSFRKLLPNIKIGSFRLRVSPNGKNGVWIDLPNEDIKYWLDEKKWLESLLSISIVEIGQKRKRLVLRDGILKLSDPKPDDWFETYLFPNFTKIPLSCLVGSFTQPGFIVNKFLVETVIGQIFKIFQTDSDSTGFNWLELGAGIGNFTIPLASLLNNKTQLHAVEFDSLAIECARESVYRANLQETVCFHKINFHKSSEKLKGLLELNKALLVDPPRSGLGATLELFKQMDVNHLPKYIVYVSCYAKSCSEDINCLQKLGYQISEVQIVDQFPQSSHFEVVVSLKRI